MRVAVLRCRTLPSFVTGGVFELDALLADDRRLMAAFARHGVHAEHVVWGDPGVDWDRFDLALIRSTWDYIDDREGFLAFLGEIHASSCKLFNPLDAVRWNSDKSYLLDLDAWRVPVVPTLPAADHPPSEIQARLLREGWQSAVVKPRIGVGAFGVRRVPAGRVAAWLQERPAPPPRDERLVQPFVESVRREGEWSFVFIGGAFSYALLKTPSVGDYRAHWLYGGSVRLALPHPDDVRQVRAMVAKCPFDLLYARVDAVRLGHRLVVMELELIEPGLYFDLAPQGPGALAAAARDRLEQRGERRS